MFYFKLECLTDTVDCMIWTAYESILMGKIATSIFLLSSIYQAGGLVLYW